ncbi:laminin subunit beta-1 isoform X2 [Zootermopsis nevadensis]|uniref:laminin subunit beta-1 isoform X2 n=1 Tax=Zootermopsis nevadensis TaxID=136037 RepID=UPI000B8EB48B|nr:laminin subunit beta-1 isoform X2 [Zootermopsis nevadensis]
MVPEPRKLLAFLIFVSWAEYTSAQRDRSRVTPIRARDEGRHGVVHWSGTASDGARNQVMFPQRSGHQKRTPVVRGDMEPEISESDIHPLSQAAYWHKHPGLIHGGGHTPQRPHPCEQSSCYPATGNLLIGREPRLSASSTCGLYAQERYCIVSHLEDHKKCFWCDSRPQNSNNPRLSHRVENIVYRFAPGIRQRSWWQSQNGVENVTIQLDLEAEFHFTHLIITFKTFRPAAMLIERSYDFGSTWQVYRYFAYNCDESYPNVPKHNPRTLTDVVCESRYSNVAPSTDGEIIFRVLPPNLPIDDPYSQEVQNLLKMTNLRINFTKLHTLGDDLLDNREEIQEKYYYAINDMIVRGSCSCYGHASRCLPLPGVEPRTDMVHGRCECTHNTKGLNCEHCEDFYNDLPWKPAIGKQTNACKRCNCNSHATSCHFDAAVYELTGQVSGGVCDGCLHDTMGRNCEQCKPFYYEDPNREITDPEVCQPCDCDPRGSLDDGTCDSRTDLANSLESGRCHCKANVDGRRCDRCKNGYWNFDGQNPEGCESCTCNTLGTIGNQGCNVYTGECTCKRYVTGRDCNQCLPEHWGLSDDRDGCKACDCDPGGAFDNNCDVITGQCRCRLHVTGRMCDQPEQSYFTGLLDYLVYEAELANCSENCQVVIREPFRDGRENTWTGTGFMRTFEDSALEFIVDNIKTSMEYDIVIRYEPQAPANWEDVRVIVERPGPVDRNGPCANSLPQDDIKQDSLPAGARSVAVFPPVCLEAGQQYKIRLEFKRYDSQVETPTASVLVDSIALVPRIESVPFFRDSTPNEIRRQEYERYRCGQAFYSVVKGNIPDVCKQYHYSIGFYVHGGAFYCQCDPTGSVSALCTSLGGVCQCKPNVVGRRCDRCAPGTFGFGPEGCRACDCNSIGALDNFCDAQTGQCKCRANTYGRECDQCQPGFWNFPNCQRCECNGHADVCDSRTGACSNCRDSTLGHHCDRCIEGYYGDPRIGVDIPCRPCPCPETVESGHSYATRCALDARTQDVVCECSVGYAGPRCDVCADNYFGNPERPGGSCRSCNCSNNIDVSRPGNCDIRTGECLQCLFNTEGFNCQICKAGYYGDAVNQECKECTCNLLGTDAEAGPCDRNTGQCSCRPNVIGLNCDQCKENHWKIASGMGCEACDCDPVGSGAEQCNQFDGQCECKQGFGGRRCNQCQDYFWGNPTEKCHACDCNPDGSATLQCNQNNGSCNCMVGIGGEKCDQCARGYIGTAPHCRPCGECFDNWDRILNDLHDQTERVIHAASEIKQTGASGAYRREFEKMEKQLNEVTQLLENTTVSSHDLERLENLVEKFRANVNKSSEKLDEVENLLDNTASRIYEANLKLTDLRSAASKLKFTALGLKENATKLQEANVEGALNLTREAEKRSQKAQEAADATERDVADSERQCKRTETIVNRTATQFYNSQEENEEAVDTLTEKLKELETQIPDLNELVCDKRGDPCDPLCGGAGCGVCGGLSCEHGAVTKADRALGVAKDAEKAIQDKENDAEELLRGISQAKEETVTARNLAKQAYDTALLASNQSENMILERTDLTDKLDEFHNMAGATPAEIRNLALETLNKDIYLRPEQITNLTSSINDTISSLKDIDTILAATSDDLDLANSLKRQADKAKVDAEGILDTAQRVVSALDEAQEAQMKAEEAIQKARDDISAAEKDLAQIDSETDYAQQKANETVKGVIVLEGRLKELQTRFLKNSRDSKEVTEESEKVNKEAKQANDKTGDLESKHQAAAGKLEQKVEESERDQTKASDLLERASKLFHSTAAKHKELLSMKSDYESNQDILNDLLNTIDDLNRRIATAHKNINSRSEYYRTCVS